jgi:hypothetical protein
MQRHAGFVKQFAVRIRALRNFLAVTSLVEAFIALHLAPRPL